MLSRVSLVGPGVSVDGAVVAMTACRGVVLDDPGTAEVSSPSEERMESELSALPLTSAPTARQEELENKREKKTFS